MRCVQTLEPLARSRDLPVETAEELVEGAAVEETVALMLAISADGPAALSTHGDVVQNVLGELKRRRVPLDGPLEARKGSTWVLDVSKGDFVGARYMPPP